MSSRFVAGKLIRARAVSLAVRLFNDYGRKPSDWRRVRVALADTFPEARANSIAAVIRFAQGVVAVGRECRRRGPDWCPPAGRVPDARRLIRDAYRGDTDEHSGPG